MDAVLGAQRKLTRVKRGSTNRAMEAECRLEPDRVMVDNDVVRSNGFRDARAASKTLGAWVEAEVTTARSTFAHAA